MTDNPLADRIAEGQALIADVRAQARREALLEAAADAERLHYIGLRPSRDVSRTELDWYKAEPQGTLLRADAYTPVQPRLLLIRDWLLALAGGRDA